MSEDRQGLIGLCALVAGGAAIFAGAAWDKGALGVSLALSLIALGAFACAAIAWLEPRR